MTNSCVDELTRRDDLLLLFNAVSSNCPERNKTWQTQASDVLILIGKHTLSSAIQCIHSKIFRFFFVISEQVFFKLLLFSFV